MSVLPESLFDGLLVGLGVSALGKGHEIAMANKKFHGTMLKWDSEIIKDSLKKNPKMTITAAIVAATVFTGGGWLSQIKSEREVSKNNAVIGR